MPDTGIAIGGDWTGIYDYDIGPGDPVPFTAMLFDIRGVVWGTTREPNTFSPSPATELVADIGGSRSGREVTFRKTYEGAPPGGEYPVRYSGLVSADGTRVEGRWQILSPFGSVEGPFVMNRAGAAVAARVRAARQTVEVPG